MSKDPDLLFEDIRIAIARIKRCVGKRTKHGLMRDEIRTGYILWNLMIIGEASSRLPKDVRAKYPEVDWKRIIAFRNVIIHGYNGIDKDIVWSVIKEKLPELEVKLKR
jgi:uncharacterized protein with HEPN domain